MKIQAFPIIAVVAVLLSIVCGASAGKEKNKRAEEPEKEDRSCKKRDADAKTEKGPVLGCNYFCHEREGDVSYVEKYYPDGVPCQYSDSLISKCTNKECPYPKEDMKEISENKDNPEEGENDDEGGQQSEDVGNDNAHGGAEEETTEGSDEDKEQTEEGYQDTDAEETMEEEKKEEEEEKKDDKKEEVEEKEEEERDLSGDSGGTADTK